MGTQCNAKELKLSAGRLRAHLRRVEMGAVGGTSEIDLIMWKISAMCSTKSGCARSCSAVRMFVYAPLGIHGAQRAPESRLEETHSLSAQNNCRVYFLPQCTLIFVSFLLL